MSFLTRFFRKANDEDYETVLSTLALDIQKRQVKLSEIRLRERRSTLLVTLYTLAGWVAYVSMWYLSVLPNISGYERSRKFEKAVKASPVIIGPVVILFVRRIVQIWYKRKGDAEEKTLQALLKQQRTKVEEIKKKTNYYSTRDLIQKYDESMSSPTLHHRPIPVSTQPSTPQRQTLPPNTNGTPQTPNQRNSNIHISPSQAPLPIGPVRKQWYDKLADAVLGDDDQIPNPASSQYALICEKCFAHNGLVKESMWEDAQYICPKCKHFNPSARTKKQKRGNPPVSSTISPAPLHTALPTPVPQQQSPVTQNGSPRDGQDASMMEVDDS